ncbi:MAG: electron transfer flavoprotein subunit alpha/FixB family protein [Alphaproteobacteria bacterium]|nr:electron transfer flavoprotein subunit alpha/FixB family protein [Alphaproteobacteria bacterium]
MAILVLAEHDNKSLKSSTANTVTAAAKIGSDVHVLVAGKGCDEAAKAAAGLAGVTKVLQADDAAFEHGLAEHVTEALKSVAGNYSHILVPATGYGKNILPRLAALLDVQPISDVMAVENETTFKRPVYAGNAIATVQSLNSKHLLSIRTTGFAAAGAGGSAAVEKISASGSSINVTFVGQELSKSERPELAAAKVVISGGRGLGSGENFAMLEKLADKLGAAIGASRAAVDAGYVPNDYQVGQTGKVVAPQLYIAVGISGAIQHLAGMKDSKVIVAINKDPDAPIFGVADYGIVGDLFQIVPELTEKI